MKPGEVSKTLDNLNYEEYERFKQLLQQSESLPGLPAIKGKRLEKARSLSIEELMVQNYTLQRCLEVTCSLLEKLDRNDLLQGLRSPRNSENRMCQQHYRSLDLFCKDDKTRVCLYCYVCNHRYHVLVPWSKEYEGQEAEPTNINDKVQQMMNKRREKIQEIKESVKISKDAADREKAEGVLVFTALKESVERGRKELIKKIEDKQKTTETEAEDFIKDLENEISNLMKRSSEVDFLQRFSSLGADPPKKKWVEDRVHPPSYEGTVERAVAQLKKTLWEDMEKRLKMKRVQQQAVDVTLDPDTAHPKLILSDDRKQVKHGNLWQDLPDYPKRFSECVCVLAEQSFSSALNYFEVQVKGKTHWDLGVARESVDRKGLIDMKTANGFWTIILRNGNKYSTGDDTSVPLHLHPGPEKVGVFVDYEEGLVSFYDVEAAALIYSFTGCCFTEKIYPFFNPCLNKGGTNSAPLIICPVNQADRCSDEAP